MAKLLFHSDSYLKMCDAILVELRESGAVLDQTIFFPSGGGQPHDTGRIICAGKEYRVVDVRKEHDEVIHIVESDEVLHELAAHVGQAVKCVVDWDRRYALMRMHTAAHALIAFLHEKYNVLGTGNQLDVEKSRIDFNFPPFNRDLFERDLHIVNEQLAAGHAVHAYELSREEALKIPGAVKLAAGVHSELKQLRMVEIEGLDLQADGGTHVANTREVGKIVLLKVDNKGKGNRRIYFALE